MQIIAKFKVNKGAACRSMTVKAFSISLSPLKNLLQKRETA
jgi:hypothetical protein